MVRNMARLIDFEYDGNEKLIAVTIEDDGDIYEMESVRHGHWVEIEESADGHLKECSVCKNWIFHNFNYVSKYCPDCGSKMDLEGW
jgi:hypothetical protein